MPHSDTRPDAEAVQVAVYTRLSGEQRIALAYDLSMTARRFALSGIRHAHPDWTDAEVLREYLRRQFPADQIPAPLR
ncbi:MAG TPA: hypothetical protein VF170_02590 [Planctomycetaceae bacterium]